MKKMVHNYATLRSFLIATFCLATSLHLQAQNLLTTNYTPTTGWYTVATNCTLDTAAGSGVLTGTTKTASPLGQTFGTRTPSGLNADGTAATATTQNTAGRYFQFKLSPTTNLYKLSATSISVSAIISGTGASVYGTVLYSTDGTTWTSPDGRDITVAPNATNTGGAGTYLTGVATTSSFLATGLSLTITPGNALYVRFIPTRLNASGASSFVVITGVTIGGTASIYADPTINLSTAALSGFAASAAAPSATKSFVLSGINLASAVTLTAPTNYEISTSANSGFGGSLSIAASGTLANTTIYARLKSGLTVGNTYNENISLTATGAVAKSVSLSGSVYNAIYYNTSSDISSPSAWNTVNGGGGTSPTDFSGTQNAYYITTNGTLSNNLVLDSLSGSRLVVGDGTNAISFTLPDTTVTHVGYYKGYVDVLANGRLIIKNNALTDLLLGNLDSLSTVQFDGSAQQTLSTNANRSNVKFGKLEITNPSGLKLGTTTTVRTACLVKTGGKLVFGISSSAINMNGTGTFTSDSASNLTICSSNGIVTSSTTSGSIRTSGIRSFNSATNFTFTTNSAAPALGTGWPAIIGDLTVDLTAGTNTAINLASNLTVNNLTITTGKVATGTKTLAIYGNLTIQAAGVLDVNGSGGAANVYGNATTPGNVNNKGRITGIIGGGFGLRGTFGHQKYYGSATGVTGAQVTNNGVTGYTGQYPTITITGDGSGATATPVTIVDPGSGLYYITGINITNGGSGYTNASIVITDTVGGLGTGAAATALLEGNTLGTAAAPFDKITVRNVDGADFLTSTNGIYLNRINAFMGTIGGAQRITLGTGAGSAATIQRGYSTVESAGSLDASPVFNLTTTDLSLIYATSSTSIVGGFEFPSNDSIGSLTMGNLAGLQINRDVTITNLLKLDSGVVTLATNKTIKLPNTAAVAPLLPTLADRSYVIGAVQRMVASANNPTDLGFPIGTTKGCRGVVLTVTQIANTPTTYTATMKTSTPTRTLPATIASVMGSRYVTISKGVGSAISFGTVKMLYGTEDLVSAEGDLRIVKDNGAGAWIDLGGTGTAAPQGEITSSNNFTSFSDFTLANVAGGLNVLPIKLANFSATKKGSFNDLQWQMAAATDLAHFEVLRSSDGLNFTSIAQLAADSRQFTDETPLANTNYYRLKMVSLANTAQYSNVLLLKNTAASKWSILANPVQNKTIQLQMSNMPKGNYALQLFSPQGQLVQKQSINYSGNVLLQAMPLKATLPRGLYLLTLSSPTESENVKVIVN